jgi:hypothetical protein
MKTLILRKILLLPVCFVALFMTVYSQPAAGFSTYNHVYDSSYKPIVNARIEAIRLFENGKSEIYAETDEFKKNKYSLYIDLPGPDQFLQEDFLMKVTADGFKPARGKVNFKDARARAFEFVLAPEDSTEESKFLALQILIINVQDKRGFDVRDAKVTFTAENGRKFDVLMSDEESFRLDLPAGQYDVEVEHDGLKRSFGKKKIIDQTSVNFFRAVL